ncbi:hypothetical protein SSX86_003837 [Deinandra increscens subsp. villosa]|uniref:Uncharacterized protein n=1 Tax=Deinandra increscens subsp. villosa TaxID=3103831 RepID=A0AAP0DM29_9ASTR
MADVAMLMAEEYEKMMKMKKTSSGDLLESSSSSFSCGVWMKKGLSLKKSLLVYEPKSKIGLATINGFFSP